MPSPCLVSGQFAQLSGAVSSAVVVGQSSRLSSLEKEVGCRTSRVFYSKEEKSRWDRKNAMQSNGVKETREIRFREMAKHVSALESSGKEESNGAFDTRPRTTGS